MQQPAVAGGVLSGAAIAELVEHPREGARPLIESFKRENLHPARYDVRIARDGCRTPDGTFLPPNGGRALEEPLVLHSGDSAWVSTLERFALPSNVAGSVTLKTDLANAGLLLLSGVLIDPGYGAAIGESDEGDRRLRFFVANLGSDPIVLHPGSTAIAAVQFLAVAGGIVGRLSTPTPRQVPTAGLGFVERLQRLRNDYGTLSRQVDRTRDLLRNLIVLGYFVLGTAVISASLATVLTIATNADLVAAAHKLMPHSTGGKALLALIVATTGWIFYSLALLLGPRHELAPEPPSAHRDLRELAIRRLRSRSVLAGIAILLALPTVVAVVAWLVVTRRLTIAFWPAWVTAASLLGGLVLLVRHDLHAPLTEWEIRQEMNRYGIDRGTSRIRNTMGRVRRRLQTMVSPAASE